MVQNLPLHRVHGDILPWGFDKLWRSSYNNAL